MRNINAEELACPSGDLRIPCKIRIQLERKEHRRNQKMCSGTGSVISVDSVDKQRNNETSSKTKKSEE